VQVLQLLAHRVLGPLSCIPRAVRGEVFGDAALLQLAELAAATPQVRECAFRARQACLLACRGFKDRLWLLGFSLAACSLSLLGLHLVEECAAWLVS